LELDVKGFTEYDIGCQVTLLCVSDGNLYFPLTNPVLMYVINY